MTGLVGLEVNPRFLCQGLPKGQPGCCTPFRKMPGSQRELLPLTALRA